MKNSPWRHVDVIEYFGIIVGSLIWGYGIGQNNIGITFFGVFVFIIFFITGTCLNRKKNYKKWEGYNDKM